MNVRLHAKWPACRGTTSQALRLFLIISNFHIPPLIITSDHILGIV